MKFIYIIMSGLFMGIADSMPGISGSSITYIMGTYSRIIESISNLSKRKKTKESFFFLLKIGLGWIFGFATSIIIISKSIESNIYVLSSLFLGLVIASIVYIFREEGIKNKKSLAYMGLGIVIIVVLNELSNNLNFSLNSINLFMYIYIFIGGMLSISAMLLPGISGSSVLLILGLYFPILNYLHEISVGNYEYIPIILIFILGIVIGIFTVARIISYAFAKKEKETWAVIKGLLIGSLIAIITAPKIVNNNNDILNLNNISYIVFLIGVVIIVLLNVIKKKYGNKYEKLENK